FLHNPTFILAYLTIKKLKSIDIINVLSDLVSGKMDATVKLPMQSVQMIAIIMVYLILMIMVI
uniref:hypothetical protein n=1 Tax=Catenibacterium mitsuokai TaxID=100886 RepID=UPI003FEE422B